MSAGLSAPSAAEIAVLSRITSLTKSSIMRAWMMSLASSSSTMRRVPSGIRLSASAPRLSGGRSKPWAKPLPPSCDARDRVINGNRIRTLAAAARLGAKGAEKRQRWSFSRRFFFGSKPGPQIREGLPRPHRCLLNAAGDERDSGQNQQTPMTRSTALKRRLKRAVRPRLGPAVRAASRNRTPRSAGPS
jgi:hypothetical protein